MSTRVLLIIVIVVIALAITSAMIGSHNHSSATVNPNDASWQPAWMRGGMAWLSAASPQRPIALALIAPAGAIAPASRTVTLHSGGKPLTLTISKAAATSTPLRITLSLANQRTPVPAGAPTLVEIAYAITDGAPPAGVKAEQSATLPVKPSKPPASGAAEPANPWQVVLVVYPGRGAQLTLSATAGQTLEVGVN
jgi:hypothetical protein